MQQIVHYCRVITWHAVLIICRFINGWDELCLQQLHLAQEAAGEERVVLSTYPLGYTGDGPAAALPEEAPATLLCAKEFDENRLLRIQGRYDHGGWHIRSSL